MMSGDTLSDQAIRFLKTSLKRCLDEHPECRQPATTYPTRLVRIEIPEDPAKYQECRIYLEESSTSTNGPYFTLSHCWGGQVPVQLTATSEPELRAGLRVHSLPKTFQEAVYVCQRLNVEYLWIDSLCIFQDNIGDWAAEAGQMHQVYAHAQCNIAATGASDSSAGLSFKRNDLAHQPFQISLGTSKRRYWVSPFHWSSLTIMSSPLNRRAWVMQERFLSNRIIHFATSGVYWECREYQTVEAPLTSQRWGKALFMEDAQLKRALRFYRTRSSHPDLLDFIYALWQSKVKAYTECGITNEKDKLVALNGITRQIYEHTGKSIVCGMWEDELLQELLWEHDQLSRKSVHPLAEWRAPSWSWASADYELSGFAFPKDHGSCFNKRAVATVVKTDVDAEPSGQLRSASLTLRGKFLHATVRVINPPTGEELTHGWKATLECSSTKTCTLTTGMHAGLVLDTPPTLPFEGQITFVLLMTCDCRNRVFHRSKWPHRSMAALALRRLDTTPTTYCRLGVLTLRGKECGFYTANESQIAEDLVIV